MSIEDGTEYPVTDLEGQQGGMGGAALATDGKYFYFSWGMTVMDLWVMDVVRE